jgi:thermitase
MDFAGHGTHVGGIASAETNNGTGIAGLGFDCLIMALRIGWLDINGWSYVRMDFASSAFYYATNKDVKSINCSWGSSYSSSFASAANYAMNNGVVVVSSAGNNNNSTASYLCSRSEVIAVAATDNTDHKASFSNYGSWVDVSAPGVNIRSTYYNNTYAYLDGTSMAAHR